MSDQASAVWKFEWKFKKDELKVIIKLIFAIKVDICYSESSNVQALTGRSKS